MKLLDVSKESQWYYVCVEFESFNRFNETISTSCRMYRTLDKFGKTADSIINDVQLAHASDSTMEFHLTVMPSFPLRLTAYLSLNVVPAVTYIIKSSPDHQVVKLMFSFLEANVNYGRLCFIEEPLGTRYTAMGRLIKSSLENCHFEHLRTKVKAVPELPPSKASLQQRIAMSFKSNHAVSGQQLHWLLQLILTLSVVLVCS
ncbi:unnamed protein product [Soboliphyme baturini]|uniref:Mediator complex subunit 20 n=1 Tax=Soboliphyme baturini TaxID=241478 RepID=A0A183INW3_9BILA|nr:unnamed protein product [Soboliphyme baturini]